MLIMAAVLLTVVTMWISGYFVEKGRQRASESANIGIEAKKEDIGKDISAQAIANRTSEAKPISAGKGVPQANGSTHKSTKRRSCSGIIAKQGGPFHHFTLFVGDNLRDEVAQGFLSTADGLAYQCLPIDRTEMGFPETLDLHSVKSIEVIPAPREEATSFINRFYNTFKIHLTTQEKTLTARMKSDLFLVTDTGRSIRLSSRNERSASLIKR